MCAHRLTPARLSVVGVFHVLAVWPGASRRMAWPLTAVTAAALALARWRRGGPAAVAASARNLDADPRRAAFMQYLRVALAAATTPVLVPWLFTLAPASQGCRVGGRGGVEHGQRPRPKPWPALLGHCRRARRRPGRMVLLSGPGLLDPVALDVTFTATGFASQRPAAHHAVHRHRPRLRPAA
jgi:hypothetical protein